MQKVSYFIILSEEATGSLRKGFCDCWDLKSHNVAPKPKMAQRIELHKNKILELAIKKKDGRPKSIKGFKKQPKPTNG